MDSQTKPNIAERTKIAVGEHYDFVWRSLRRLGVAESFADDATQKVFCVFAKRAESIEPGKDKTFLFGVTIRVAQAVRREQGKHANHTDEEALITLAATDTNPEVLLDDRRARGILDGLLAEMPLDLRTIFILYEIEEMTMIEIASILELPSGTVASRLKRARELFQQLSKRARAHAEATKRSR